MSWSLGEIRSLSIKAARGAGMDWGIAEEAGFAVHWLEAHGLNGTRALAQYLSFVQNHKNFDDENCPLKLGCLVSDTGSWAVLSDKSTPEPVLLVPFIASVLGDESVELEWENNSIVVHHDGVSNDEIESLTSKSEDLPCPLIIKASSSPKPLFNTKNRVLDDARSYVEILNRFAHKTYAPATAASRLAGAGAGLNDND